MGTGITAETQEIPVAAPEPAGDGKGALPMGSLTTFCLLEIPVLSQPLILAFLTWPDQRGVLWDKNRTGAVSSFSPRDSESQNLVFEAGKGPQGQDWVFWSLGSHRASLALCVTDPESGTRLPRC